MIIGSKFQLRSLNLDDFAISVNADKLQLVEKAKYLGLWVRNDLSWDDHILELCRKMYYYVHMFRRLRKILPSQLLLNIYKSYVQSKIDYGLSIWGCTTEANLDRTQRIQNLLARIMCNNFDYINFRGIEMVRTLRLQRAVSIRKTVLPGMAIPMLKIRRPNGRLIFNMEIAIRR